MATTTIELTVLMPCLDEVETLEVCINKAKGYFKRAKVRGEVLIADNGSTDGSQALAKKLGARVVDVEVKGYGAALAGGIAAARGEFIIMADADDSYDFSKLDDFVAELRNGADLVMGNRFLGGIDPGAMPPLHRYLGNPVLSFVGRLFFESDIGDFHCGLRGFRRDAIISLHLRTTGMEFASEMVVKATQSGLNMKEVPTRLAKDGRSRAPHLRSFRDGWRHLRFLLLFSPRWLFFYPGAVLLFLGLTVFSLLSVGPLRITPEIELDVHTMLIASMGILTGLQAISFALIGRSFATRYGFMPPSASWSRILDALTLERILLVALLLIAGGVAGVAWATMQWARVGFGELLYSEVMRVLIMCMTGLVAGLQLAMTGFLASMINIPFMERRVNEMHSARANGTQTRTSKSVTSVDV